MSQIIQKSKFEDMEIPDNVSLPSLILQRARRFGSKPALICAVTGRSYTYTEYVDAVRKTASGFARRGVVKGDVVMLCLPNSIEYPVLLMSACSLGAVVTTANPMYTSKELQFQMEDANAKYVVTNSDAADKITEAANNWGKIKEKFVFGQVSGYTPISEVMSDPGYHQPAVNINPHEDVVVLPYSSGTTGRPKGVMLTHYNLVANIIQCSTRDISPDLHPGEETYVCVLPFYHIYGITVLNIYGLYEGNALVVHPKFELRSYLQSIQQHKATILHIVPPIAVVLTKSPIIDEFSLSSVHTVFSGAAPMGKDLAVELMTRLKIDNVRQGYGMTEFSPIVTMCPTDMIQVVHGSSGILITSTVGRVVHVETGKDLPVGADGELWFKGPQVMKGYLNRPEATAGTIDKEGWLHTGDIGHVDKDGNYFIVDRLKELIKYKGLQVAPADLESLLLTHPAVADAAVIGLPDQAAGELPRAYCVKKPGVSVTDADIAKFVTDRVSPHKRLRGGVEFIPEIPKSASGKILRRVLRVMAKANTKSKL